MLDWILKADGDILLFLQNYVRNALTDGFWKLITFLGDGGWFWIATGILLLFFAKTRKAGVTALLALLLGALVTNLLLKNLVARPRPYDMIAGLTPLCKEIKGTTPSHPGIPAPLLQRQWYTGKCCRKYGEGLG